MIILGLTGSIGMGKTTTARFFAEEGISVYSADEAVRMLYQQKPVISKIDRFFPEAVANAVINRKKLAGAVFGKPEALLQLEAIVHPHVRKAEEEFLQTARTQGYKLAVLDIPLLLEIDGLPRVDRVAVVSAPFALQRERVLRRPDMTEERFLAILARQMPDEEKRKRADFIIDTSKRSDEIQVVVRELIKTLTSP